MLCLTGTTGNIGSAVLRSLLENALIPPSQLIISTSSSPSDPKFSHYTSLGITVRHASYDDPSSLVTAFAGCDAIFLVSTPKIALDFGGDVPVGSGREGQHFKAIEAAKKVGVKHVYYTSLAFGFGLEAGASSKAGVMQAHERTEAYLKKLSEAGDGNAMSFTSIREGLYAESWPLYLGQYDVAGNDPRTEIVLGGDGKVAWTAIEDLGLATALILSAELQSWRNKTVYLSSRHLATLDDIASFIALNKNMRLSVKTVSRAEYERHSIEDRGMDAAFVKWWSGSYEALSDGECEVLDGTLDVLLASQGRVVTRWEDIVQKMVRGEMTYSSSEART